MYVQVSVLLINLLTQYFITVTFGWHDSSYRQIWLLIGGKLKQARRRVNKSKQRINGLISHLQVRTFCYHFLDQSLGIPIFTPV